MRYFVNPAAIDIARDRITPGQCKVLCKFLMYLVSDLGWRPFDLDEICRWLDARVKQIHHDSQLDTGEQLVMMTHQKVSWIFRYYVPMLLNAGVITRKRLNMKVTTKVFKVLEFIAASPEGRTFGEIQKFVVQNLNGLDWNEKTTNSSRRRHRGYWCVPLSSGQNAVLPRFCKKENHRYKIAAKIVGTDVIAPNGDTLHGGRGTGKPRPVKLRDVEYFVVSGWEQKWSRLRAPGQLGVLMELLAEAGKVNEFQFAKLVRTAAATGRLRTSESEPFAVFRRHRKQLIKMGVLRMDPPPGWYVEHILHGGRIYGV